MLQAVDIRTVWDAISPSIEKIRSELPWSDWRLEDIYAACLSGRAVVLIQPDAAPQSAFGVVRLDTCEQTGRKCLFLWIAWCENEEGAQQVYEDLDEIALRSQCDSIDFITGSEKLVKYAQNFGYCAPRDLLLQRRDRRLSPILPRL
jgi:hypothetical protein